MNRKKLIVCLVILAIIGLVIGIFAITKSKENIENSNINLNYNNANNVAEKDSSKILVVYFSKDGENYGVGNVEKGNTQILAEMTQEKLNTDIFEIVPENLYTASYDDVVEQAQKEKKENARPKIVGKIDDLSKYSTIFMMMPVWWNDMPMCVYTFLDDYDLSGKVINVLVTHAGSGLSGIPDKIAKEEPNATINGKIAILGTTAQQNKKEAEKELDGWLNSMGYNIEDIDKNGQTKNTIIENVKTNEAEINNSNSTNENIERDLDNNKSSIETTLTNNEITIEVNGNNLKLKLEENDATKQLIQRLTNGNIQVNAREYGGFEKVGSLGFDIPQNDKQIKTESGDLVLYQGNQVSLFYNSNSWSYTKLGKIQDVSDTELEKILGSGDVTLIFKLK